MFILTTDQELWASDHSLGLKDFLDQLNLLYIWICNKSRVIDTRANGPHYRLEPPSRPEGYT
jgi:hypothetical protein